MDELDDSAFTDDEAEDWVEDQLEEDREADCGRWDNGRLVRQCRLAGTEWCDWECLIGLSRDWVTKNHWGENYAPEKWKKIRQVGIHT